MPNPVRPLKRNDRLSPRQKGIVKRLKANGISPLVYKRGRGLSVHDPMLDVKRKARAAVKGKVKRYPHARDTPAQVRYKPKMTRRGKPRKAPKSILLP